MTLLFFIPLVVITILYTLIGVALWKSSRSQMPASSASETSSSSQGGETGAGNRKRNRPSCHDVFCCSSNCWKKARFSFTTRPNLRRETDGTREREMEVDEEKPDLKSSIKAPSPYSTAQRNNHGISISTNEPIVVVRFDEKKNSFHRGSSQKRSKCTILMNASNLVLNRKFNAGGCPNDSTRSTSNTLVKGFENFKESHPRSENRAEGAEPSAPICSPNTSSPIPLGNGNEHLGPNGNGNGLLQPRTPELNGHVPQPQHRLRRMRVIRGGKYGTRALEARRKIIKMLVVIVVVFALCNLPFHARKLWQILCSTEYPYVFTPITFLIMYANSAINPLLYAFMSKKFRLCVADFLGCRLRRSLRMARNASVRSTHIIPMSTAA